MESAYRAARNGNEAKGENLSGKDRAGAIDEARKRRHQDLWPDKEDARGQSKNGSGLDERTEIVARCKQQPDWQRRSRKTIHNDGERKRHTAQREYTRPGGRIGDPLPRDHDEKDERHSHYRSFQNAAGPHKTKVKTEEQRDGDGHGQREGGPWRGLESIHHDEANHGKKNRHDREHGQLRDEAAAFANLFARHLAEGFPVAANRAKENDKILHAAGKRRAGNQPERARQVTELRGECRADERARPGDGGKMVAKENPFVRRHEVAAIVVAFTGSGAGVIERENFGGDEGRIETVSHQITANSSDNEPSRIERL